MTYRILRRNFARTEIDLSVWFNNSSITSSRYIVPLRSIQEAGRLINDKKIPSTRLATHFSKQNGEPANESNQATNHRHANYRAINIGRISLDKVA